MDEAVKNLITDTDLDERMDTIKSLVSQRLCNLINETDVPSELEYVVTEVSIARFNRIGSEGISSHSVASESMSWSEDLFAPYLDDIQAYLNHKASKSGSLRGKFI